MSDIKKNKINKVETWLPVFNGFYHSVFEVECPIERDLESGESDEEILKYYDELGIDLKDFDWFKGNYHWYVNYSAINNEAASIIVDSLKDIDGLGLIKSVEYQKVVSPKYYNFTSDSINCIIEADYKKINEYLKENVEKFKRDRLDRYTSRDGFSSHYSSDLDYWLDQENWDDHGLASVLDFILKNEHQDAVMDLYWACQDNYIYEAAHCVNWLDDEKFKASYKEYKKEQQVKTKGGVK